MRGPSVGDVDGDGEMEILVPSLEGLYVYTAEGSLEASLPGNTALWCHPCWAM